MKKLYLINILLVLAIILSSPNGKSQCVSDTNNIYTFTYNNAKYEIVKEKKNWVSASACAVERGGILAEINSQVEQDSVFFHVNNAGIVAANTVAPDGGGASYLWLGGNDRGVEGKWVWNGDNDATSVQFWQGTRAGSAVGGLYNNWGNEPDDWNGQDGLGLAFTNWPLGTAGQWNDVKDTNQLYYIIEYEQDLSGIDESEINENSFSIFPNPASGQVTFVVSSIKYTGDNSTISIFNSLGKLVKKLNVLSTKFQIDISGLEKGLYFLKLENEDYKSQTSKLIVH